VDNHAVDAKTWTLEGTQAKVTRQRDAQNQAGDCARRANCEEDAVRVGARASFDLLRELKATANLTTMV
jgi:hypothetical protein